MNQKRYYPTAFALYLCDFVLGIASSIMGHYKQEFAELWGASILDTGLYDVSGVVAVIAAIGLGRLIAFPIAGPLSDRLGRRLSVLIGCILYAIFMLVITFTPNIYAGYAIVIISGMANSFLDTGIIPSCIEIFKEKGTIAYMFTKLSSSVAQFLLPFAIGFTAAKALPFNLIFLITAVIIIVNGIALIFLPFPPHEHTSANKDAPKEKMHFTPSSMILVALGFTTSTTFMLWLNCNQELGALYGLSNPSLVQSYYSIGIIVALFVNAWLLNKGIKPVKILIIYPSASLLTLAVVYLVQIPEMCLIGGALMGFFAAGGMLQLVTAIANEMFPKNRGIITSIVMIASSVANYVVLNAAGMLTRMGGTNGPRLVMLLNISITFIGIALAIILDKRLDKDTQTSH